MLVLLDAGHSGATTVGGSPLSMDSIALRTALAAANVSVLTSSTGPEVSFEDPKLEHGAFTKALLDAFDDPAAERQPERPDNPDPPRRLYRESRAHADRRQAASGNGGALRHNALRAKPIASVSRSVIDRPSRSMGLRRCQNRPAARALHDRRLREARVARARRREGRRFAMPMADEDHLAHDILVGRVWPPFSPRGMATSTVRG